MVDHALPLNVQKVDGIAPKGPPKSWGERTLVHFPHPKATVKAGEIKKVGCGIYQVGSSGNCLVVKVCSNQPTNDNGSG